MLIASLSGLSLGGCLPHRAPPSVRVEHASCATGAGADRVLDYGLRLAEPDARETWGLGSLDSAGVALVSEAATCRRAAESFNALVPPEARERKYDEVGVVRLGQAGFLVWVPSSGVTAGEFTCDHALFDGRWRRGQLLCG